MGEPTTILSGSAAEGGTIVVRDHGAWAAQVQAEKRRAEDERICAVVAGIRDGEAERASAAALSLTELAEEARVSILLAEQARESRRREAARVDELGALAGAMAAAEPPRPDRDAERREAARARDQAASAYYYLQRQGG
jgi:hypothetical protein